MSDVGAGREFLEREVAARTQHKTAESVRTTCSFARAERLLGGEYHGRFLIEMLQNAADAWRRDPRAEDSRSRVAVSLTQGPALLVANQGATLTPQVVIESLGHIGASTKSEGEAIGHKGIGFKSVLEMSSRPELYSGLQNPDHTLAVRFDPEEALNRIKRASEHWSEFVAGTHGLDVDDPLAPVPILRYPLWVDAIPEEVREFAASGFDTVVRLPFEPEVARRRGITEQQWLDEIRRALRDDLSDQILLLLGTFSEVQVHDQLDGQDAVTIRPAFAPTPAQDVLGAAGELVTVHRTGHKPTHWRMYRRFLPEAKELAGEIAVGVRFEQHDSHIVVPAVDGGMSAPFHLFFPTKIPSGLPFLLHGYFKVDASRKGFHGAANQDNQRILRELAKLVRDVVRSTGRVAGLDATSLVNRIADCPEPEDELARAFREEVLVLLDEEDWISAVVEDDDPQLSPPRDFLVDSPRFTRLVADVFPASYVRQRAQLSLLHQDLTDASIELVRSRQRDRPNIWEVLGLLCRPGEIDVWTEQQASSQFRKFLALVNWLSGEFPEVTERLLASLRGDSSSRLLPVVAGDGGIRLLPLPDPSEGVAGQRSQLVMARIRSTNQSAPVPPPQLEVAFLPAGLLSSELEVTQTRHLGIRPFTVDNVLDRLNGVGRSPENAPAVLTFLWEFLARERRNQYGTKKVAERAADFNPSRWFWCRPGRARESGAKRLEQQRERYLTEVLLPSRDGHWRPAGQLAFGRDWSDWLEEHLPHHPDAARRARGEAYRGLEEVCLKPGEQLLAAPSEILTLLEKIDIRETVDEDQDDSPGNDGDDGDPADEELSDASWDQERHAFLLRLGVWEVLPIEAIEGRDRRDQRARFPWAGPTSDSQREICANTDGWTFGLDGWSGQQHREVYLAEDYRFQWPLAEAAMRNPREVAKLILAGSRLYESRLLATFFCPGCSDSGSWHKASRQSTTADGYPSVLALQLREERWVPVDVAGEPADTPAIPSSAWWLEKAPAGQGLMTSPWRFVPICSPQSGITADLRRMACVTTIGDAGAPELTALLLEMRRAYESGDIQLTRSTDRRSFVSLHTLAYDRLAELPEGAGQAALQETGVLCALGDTLLYEHPENAKHDEGTYASYVRYFVSTVPLAVIPRDQSRVSNVLGIGKFVIDLQRGTDDDGVDVTDELTGLLSDRMPELLAILVHHSLGSQPITLDGDEFRRRARRLKRLTVRKVEDLVIHASVDGVDRAERLGSGRSGDLFLETGSGGHLVLFHDFDGDGWQDRLRRKIAPYLATVLDATPYAHTFALFLQCEGDADREEFLLELSISDDDVDSVKTQLGVVSDSERRSHQRWFTSLLQVLGAVHQTDTLDHDSLVAALIEVGLTADRAQRIAQAGGGDEVRSSSGQDSVLRALREHGVDLRALDAALRALGEEGLKLSDARRALQEWKRIHERRVVAVRAKRVSPDQAKDEVRAVGIPDSVAFDLDVPLTSLLAGVAEIVAPNEPTFVEELAADAQKALAQVGGFASPGELDAAALRLYDVEEQRRALSSRAARWRTHIRRLATLARMSPTETRADIRLHDEAVRDVLSMDLHRPTDLSDAVERLFSANPVLRMRLLNALDDDVLGEEPDEKRISQWERELGIGDTILAKYQKALTSPRNGRITQLRTRASRLAAAEVTAAVPPGLMPPSISRRRRPQSGGQEPSSAEPIKVAKIKVGAHADQRKRELGDEGEQWALADAVRTFLAMSETDRASAIDDVRLLLGHFEGDATRKLLEHASAAAAPRTDDDDELVSALEGLLHVSLVSDGFGFDLIGWAAAEPDASPHALCLEVKSTSGGGFHLSSHEWRIARELRDKGAADRYAVLAVRRGESGEVPTTMHLLADPVGLEELGLLVLETDGYIARYAPS